MHFLIHILIIDPFRFTIELKNDNLTDFILGFDTFTYRKITEIKRRCQKPNMILHLPNIFIFIENDFM
jgi:hypothetical protein